MMIQQLQPITESNEQRNEKHEKRWRWQWQGCYYKCNVEDNDDGDDNNDVVIFVVVVMVWYDSKVKNVPTTKSLC